MTTFHIPERLSSQDVLRGRACFIPDAYRAAGSNNKSSKSILETFDFRIVGQVVADSQLNGCAASQVNVINYTEDFIVSLDKWNRVTIIPPVPETGYGRQRYDGCIFIEVVNSKAYQTADIGARIYKRYRNVPLLHKGDIGSYYYKEPTREESPKFQGNQIHQFSIADGISQMNEHGGSFYCPNTDLVFMTMEAAESGDLVLHPNTDVTTLAELGLDEECCRVITHQISVNNMKSAASFVNIGGDVISIPNTRDPNQPTGITIRRLENRRGTKMKLIFSGQYEFDDPSCPIHVFDSENAAITNGNPDKTVELEIVKTKLLTEKAKAVNARDSQEFAQTKVQNDKVLEEERLKSEQETARKAQATRDAQEKARRAQAQAEQEKAEQARKENKQSHRSRMLEIGGKIVLALAGIATAALSIYRLKKS